MNKKCVITLIYNLVCLADNPRANANNLNISQKKTKSKKT